MDPWFAIYATLALQCNTTILNALDVCKRATSPREIWRQLEKQNVEHDKLLNALQKIASRNDWDSDLFPPHQTFWRFRPRHQDPPPAILVILVTPPPAILVTDLAFWENHGNLRIALYRQPKGGLQWDNYFFSIYFSGDDGYYNVCIGTTRQLDFPIVTEMRIFSEQFAECFNSIRPTVEEDFRLLVHTLHAARPTSQQITIDEQYLTTAIRSYLRKLTY